VLKDYKNKFEKDKMCEVYQKRKQIKVSFGRKNCVSTKIHMDLFGPFETMILSGNFYALV